MANYLDNITSLFNALINRRSARANNVVSTQRVPFQQLAEIAKTGLGVKIIRMKAGYALNDTLQFDSTQDAEFYRSRLESEVKAQARNMLVFGRGIVVLQERGVSLAEPLRGVPDPARLMVRGFGGEMVTATQVSVDLNDKDYLIPRFYNVRGFPIHRSRVVDFRYVLPPELQLPEYQYGGISEFELIYDQIINDGVVQRASPAILERNASLFYKVKGFKEAMIEGREADMVKYFGRLEDGRSIYGAGLMDEEDSVEVANQALTNLADADMITLRRLAMVTGIPLPLLVGENVKGLNSTGENERASFQDMIETLQSDHLQEPINRLMTMCGKAQVSFKDNQGQTADGRIKFEQTAIDNALKLWQMGEDNVEYLRRHAVTVKDDFAAMFPDDEA